MYALASRVISLASTGRPGSVKTVRTMPLSAIGRPDRPIPALMDHITAHLPEHGSVAHVFADDDELRILSNAVVVDTRLVAGFRHALHRHRDDPDHSKPDAHENGNHPPPRAPQR